MLRRSLLVAIALWLSISILSGQSYFKGGYIISPEMDTIYGRIDFRGEKFNSANCVFITDQGEEPVTYKPGSIYGYRFNDGNFYLSKTVVTDVGPQNIFFEVLLSGIINLFYYHSSTEYNFYLETAKGGMVRLYEEKKMVYNNEGGRAIKTMKYYVGHLRYAMSDAPELSRKIDHVTLQQKDLVQLLQKYHGIVCDNMDCITYSKSFPGIKIQVAPFVSWQTELLKINGQSEYASLKYQAAYYPSAGLSLVASMPGISERFSVRTDISLGKRYFYGFRVEEINVNTHYMEAHLSHTALTGDLKVNYTAPEGRFRPSYSGGISLQKNLAASHRMEMDIMTTSVIEPLTFHTNAWCDPWLGFNAGAGFETRLLPPVTVYCMFQYRNLFYFKDSSVITSFGLTAGFIF